MAVIKTKPLLQASTGTGKVYSIKPTLNGEGGGGDDTVKIGVNTGGDLSVLDYQVKINNDIYNVTSFDNNHGYIAVPLDTIMSEVPVSVAVMGSNIDAQWYTNFPDEPYSINGEYVLPGNGIFSISIFETVPPA